MSINLDKIIEHIDRIGIEEVNRRLDSYPSIGPTVEEYFGKEKCDEFKKKIAESGGE